MTSYEPQPLSDQSLDANPISNHVHAVSDEVHGLHNVHGLIVMDIDATLIDEEVIDELARAAGVEDQVAPITAQAMRGELDFEQALRHRVALLKGLPTTIFQQVAEHVHPTHGVRELIDTAHAHGWKVGVVSGGFHEVADLLVAQLHLDRCLANRLAVADGKLTGELTGPIVTKTLKEQTLRQWAAEYGLDMQHTVAIGDGANDIPMILAAGTGIAFCAKPKTEQAAPYAIKTRDLMLAWDIITMQPAHSECCGKSHCNSGSDSCCGGCGGSGCGGYSECGCGSNGNHSNSCCGNC